MDLYQANQNSDVQVAAMLKLEGHCIDVHQASPVDMGPPQIVTKHGRLADWQLAFAVMQMTSKEWACTSAAQPFESLYGRDHSFS